MNNIVTGVDIGGTHITSCLIDIDTGNPIEGSDARGDIDPHQNEEHIIRSWAETIAASSKKHGIPMGHIGIAMPGPFDYEKGVSLITGLHKYECLYKLNVKDMLSRELGISTGDIRMMNDASAFLSGEAKSGAGKGCKHLAGITLGTGLGSAKFIDGQCQDAELWRMPFRGSRAEEYLSSRWFISEYEKKTGKKVNGVRALADLAETDTVARNLFEEFGYTLGEVLTRRFSDHFPERIVVGGNISKAWHLFNSHCSSVVKEHAPECMLIPARLGENAALIGAACLWE